MNSTTHPTSDVAQKSSKNTYRSSQDVRWCSGCGDFHVLNALTSAWAHLQLKTKDIALISGIGCSSRLPYYCSTYGFHTIHGRAPTIALGLKMVRPELSVWIITGDGDALSIGGNHLIHLCRKNPDITLLLFNNEIYGLTKGQASPTSQPGLTTKSTPHGSDHNPINALSLVISSGANFVARVVDTDLSMMRDVFQAAYHHPGLSVVEILTSCVVFNEEAFTEVEKKSSRKEHCLILKPGEPLVFGKNREHTLIVKDWQPEVVPSSSQEATSAMTHAPHLASRFYSLFLANLKKPLPLPLGILRSTTPTTVAQKPRAQSTTDLDDLLKQASFTKDQSQ